MPVIATLLFIAVSLIVVLVVYLGGKWFRSKYSPVHAVKSLLFKETPFQVATGLSPRETERRIKDETSRFVNPFLMSQRLVGRIKDHSIEIGLHRPIASNAFVPIFVGLIKLSDGQTIVTGVFRVHKFTRIFMVVWFGFLAFWSVFGIPVGLIMLIAGEPDGALFVFVPIVMFIGGIGLVKFGAMIGEKDQAIIKSKIIETVGGTES